MNEPPAVCPKCGIGFELPSGRCDHCNLPFALAENPCSKIFDHKWLDPACVESGCQSLFITQLQSDLAAANGKLEAIEKEIHAVKDPGVIRANIHRILHPQPPAQASTPEQ